MMHKVTAKSFLLGLICALVISGCAKPITTDDMTSVSKPSSDMAISALQPNITKPPSSDVQTVQSTAVQAVYFAYDQSTLSEQARDTLTANAAILLTVPDVKARIEGHCDNRGSDEYNLALGERRAQSVRTYLVSLGIAPERLETISYGEEMLINNGSTEMALAKNRRAEFTFE